MNPCTNDVHERHMHGIWFMGVGLDEGARCMGKTQSACLYALGLVLRVLA